jgi:hypothetical protein
VVSVGHHLGLRVPHRWLHGGCTLAPTVTWIESDPPVGGWSMLSVAVFDPRKERSPWPYCHKDLSFYFNESPQSEIQRADFLVVSRDEDDSSFPLHFLESVSPRFVACLGSAKGLPDSLSFMNEVSEFVVLEMFGSLRIGSVSMALSFKRQDRWEPIDFRSIAPTSEEVLQTWSASTHKGHGTRIDNSGKSISLLSDLPIYPGFPFQITAPVQFVVDGRTVWGCEGVSEDGHRVVYDVKDICSILGYPGSLLDGESSIESAWSALRNLLPVSFARFFLDWACKRLPDFASG